MSLTKDNNSTGNVNRQLLTLFMTEALKIVILVGRKLDVEKPNLLGLFRLFPKALFKLKSLVLLSVAHLPKPYNLTVTK